MSSVKIIGSVLLAVLLVSAAPYAAQAGAIRIRPDQFEPCVPNDDNLARNAEHLSGMYADTLYYAKVDLPVGRRVTELTLFYESGPAPNSSVELYRKHFTDFSDSMAVATATESTTGIGSVSDTSIDYPVVQGGQCVYYVQVVVAKGDDVFGVKVKYQ